MRWYNIVISDPDDPSKKQIYTSHVGGVVDFGALNVVMDIPQAAYGTPMGAAMLEIWGIPLQSISSANNLAGKNISISGGFQPGLPLATLASRNQRGPLINGYIVQCFGNWVGNDMTLNVTIVGGPSPTQTSGSGNQTASAAGTGAVTVAPPTGSNALPVNLAFYMPPGMPMATAIDNMLAAAMPQYTREIQIADITYSQIISAGYNTLQEAAQKILEISKEIKNDPTYQGVNITLSQNNYNSIRVFDGTQKTTEIDIKFQDLIGQPTWINPQKIQFKCPMRADISTGYTVIMPQDAFYGIAPSTPAFQNNYRFRSAQRGKFLVTEVRHIGNFRQPDANSWVTIVQAAQKLS